MFSYFDYLLKQLLFEKYPQTNDDFADIAQITPKTITEEYRKFLDKVSIRIIIDMFEQEEYVNAILKLARVERIIIIYTKKHCTETVKNRIGENKLIFT